VISDYYHMESGGVGGFHNHPFVDVESIRVNRLLKLSPLPHLLPDLTIQPRNLSPEHRSRFLPPDGLVELDGGSFR